VSAQDIPWAEIDAAILDGRMVDAVRMYRLASGSAIGPAVLLLNERRDYLETTIPMPSVPVPGPAAEIAAVAPTASAGLDESALARIRAFEDSAFCPAGGRIAAWRNARGEVCVLHRRDARTVEINLLPASGNYGHDLHGFSMGNEELVGRLQRGGSLEPADFGGSTALSELILKQLAPMLDPVSHADWLPSRATVFALDALRFEARYAFRAESWTRAEWQGALDRASRFPGLADALAEAEADGLPSGEAFAPTPAQSRLLLHLCIAECGVDRVQLDHEHFFADLATRRIEQVPPVHRDSWSALVGVADPTGHRRSSLPPWLDRATRGSQIAGLSPPGMARFLVPRLEGCLPPGRDLDALWPFLAGAAGRGNWLLGLAPTS